MPIRKTNLSPSVQLEKSNVLLIQHIGYMDITDDQTPKLCSSPRQKKTKWSPRIAHTSEVSIVDRSIW